MKRLSCCHGLIIVQRVENDEHRSIATRTDQDHVHAYALKERSITYRDPPAHMLLQGEGQTGIVSVPLGPGLAIFDQVRGQNARNDMLKGRGRMLPSKRASLNSNLSRSIAGRRRSISQQPQSHNPGVGISVPARVGGTMTRGPTGGIGKSMQPDQLQWLQSIRRGDADRRSESRSGTGTDSSRPGSRIESLSRSRGTSASRTRAREGSGSAAALRIGRGVSRKGRNGQGQGGSGSRDWKEYEEEGHWTLQDESVFHSLGMNQSYTDIHLQDQASTDYPGPI
jgi:hypothetical protein